MQHDQEFWASVAIIGGAILGGSMIMIGLTLVGLAVYNLTTKKKVIKELYDEKQKENGQAKGGSRGSW